MEKKQLNKKILTFSVVALMVVFIALIATLATAVIDLTRPTIISVSPTNNQLDIATHDSVMVQFSEPMDPATINSGTFIVMQTTTPADSSLSSAYRSIQLEGTVTYNGLTATFKPKTDSQSSYNPMQPSQQYGNVFTVTITSGAKDLAGNSLSRDYMWSFTTGNNPFNTGIATSQPDQSSAAITGTGSATDSVTDSSSIAPVVAAPITTNAQTATGATGSNLSWLWAVGLLVLLLFIAFIFNLLNRPTRQKNTQIIPPSPFGEVHPVMDIEGIGPEYKKGLSAMGIKNTSQLRKADAVKLARGTGAPLSSVVSWQHMAELASVKGIGPQYAELLERSGIHTIEQLKNSNPNKVLRLINEKQDSLKINIQGSSLGHATVEHWIDEARDHRFSASEGQIA